MIDDFIILLVAIMVGFLADHNFRMFILGKKRSYLNRFFIFGAVSIGLIFTFVIRFFDDYFGGIVTFTISMMAAGVGAYQKWKTSQ
jgi:hypothetical protein